MRKANPCCEPCRIKGLLEDNRSAMRSKNAKPTFVQGDIVRPSRTYLRSIGGKGPSNGLVAGWSGNFVVVAWSDSPNRPVAVSTSAIDRIDHKSFNIPHAKLLLKKWRKEMTERGASKVEMAGIHTGEEHSGERWENAREVSRSSPRSRPSSKPSFMRLANRLRNS